MRPSPKLRPNGWDALLAALVLALALGGGVLLARGGGGEERLTAVVTIDGAEADRFALAELLEAPRTYTAGGYTLEVVYSLRGAASAPGHQAVPVEEGVCVALSDCPTQDCVRTGVITRGGQSIVCLPARFILRLEGEETAGAEDGVDAVLG